ncbi:hypothetical protein P7C70_g9395, partial [Phenoliferia sp. Uapishka_3]
MKDLVASVQTRAGQRLTPETLRDSKLLAVVLAELGTLPNGTIATFLPQVCPTLSNAPNLKTILKNGAKIDGMAKKPSTGSFAGDWRAAWIADLNLPEEERYVHAPVSYLHYSSTLKRNLPATLGFLGFRAQIQTIARRQDASLDKTYNTLKDAGELVLTSMHDGRHAVLRVAIHVEGAPKEGKSQADYDEAIPLIFKKIEEALGSPLRFHLLTQQRATAKNKLASDVVLPSEFMRLNVDMCQEQAFAFGKTVAAQLQRQHYDDPTTITHEVTAKHVSGEIINTDITHYERQFKEAVLPKLDINSEGERRWLINFNTANPDLAQISLTGVVFSLQYLEHADDCDIICNALECYPHNTLVNWINHKTQGWIKKALMPAYNLRTSQENLRLDKHGQPAESGNAED